MLKPFFPICSETTAYGLFSFSLKAQIGHRVTSGSCTRRKHVCVRHIHHFEKGWRCSSPSLRWLARPQYGLLLFSRWLTVKTRNYVKVNTTGIMKELQSRCGDVIGRLFKTHTRTHTQAHSTLDEKLRPGVLPISAVIFIPLFLVCRPHIVADRRTDRWKICLE